jgi:hypothetical protein
MPKSRSATGMAIADRPRIGNKRLTTMERILTPEQRDWLHRLDTDAPTKPEPPAQVKEKLVKYGLAIELVEGGLQLTTLGREALSSESGVREGSGSRSQ